MQEFNIVDLIENNPISKLSQTYNSKLISKIKEIFTDFEQQLFVSSFYCYLNYNKNTDFVVDLDNVWKWLGFNQKYNAERVLESNFSKDIDYKTAPQFGKAVSNVKQNGGQNIKKIFLTVKCFKSLCLKAQTKKAAEIHEYYIKLEETLHEIVEEETDELRLQLEQKDNIILEIKEDYEKIKRDSEKIKKDSLKSVEQAIINQFPLNTECIYIGYIDNTNEANEKLIKFGQTNNLATRVNDHRKIYDNFILITAFRVQNKTEIEGLIKTSNKIRRQIRNVEIKGQIRKELIAYDTSNFTTDKLVQYIKDIINSKIYNIDNFNKLLKQNEYLEARVRELEKENEELKEQLSPQILNKSISAITNADNQFVYQYPSIPIELVTKFNEFIDTMCLVRYDVEETSTNIEGQFRIWLRTKPQKEIFHTFKQYLETRFRRARLTKQDSTNVVYGYVGVKIKPIEYKKQFVGNDIETFLFQSCNFSPSGKILNSVLFEEYKQWNQKLNKEVTDVNINELKEYLKNCEYVIKSVVWSNIVSNDGYYGISLKNKEYVKNVVSTTGKKVEKIELSTGYILDTWDSIAKAAVSENISAAKMSRSIKNNVTFNDYFYRIQAV